LAALSKANQPSWIGHQVLLWLNCFPFDHAGVGYVKFLWPSRSGGEVDFIVPLRGHPPMLVQVCGSLTDSQTRKRETAALSEAMAELGLKTGTIVTRNEDERVDAETGTIEVIPAWRYLLDLPESAE
jgi:uncharacterized protein